MILSARRLSALPSRSPPGPSFAVYGARLADNSAPISVDSKLHIMRSLSLLTKLDGEFAAREQLALGRAIQRYTW